MTKKRNNPYENKSTFEKHLNTPEGEDYIDNYVAELYEINLNAPCDVPYWVEQYYNQSEDYKAEYVPGYWDEYRTGDNITVNGIEYKYIDSVLLSEELEFQLDDDTFYYHNVGSSFLRILQLL